MDVKYTTKQQIADLQKELQDAKAQAHRETGASAGRKALRAINWAVFLIAFLLLSVTLVSVLVARGSGQTPTVLGYQLYVVQSGSMEPTLNVGSIILSRVPRDPSALRKGNVVTFVDEGMTITHRIVEVIIDNGQITYRTKGDNPENAMDPHPLTTDRVKAVFVLRVPFT